MKEMEINAGFLRLFGDPVNHHHGYMKHLKNIAEAFRKGKKEWAELLVRSNEWCLDTNSRSCGIEDKAQGSLVKWMTEFEDWDGPDAEPEPKPKPDQPAPKALSPGTVSLMTCSWCLRPSAALKKCGGCGQEK